MLLSKFYAGTKKSLLDLLLPPLLEQPIKFVLSLIKCVLVLDLGDYYGQVRTIVMADRFFGW